MRSPAAWVENSWPIQRTGCLSANRAIALHAGAVMTGSRRRLSVHAGTGHSPSHAGLTNVGNITAINATGRDDRFMIVSCRVAQYATTTAETNAPPRNEQPPESLGAEMKPDGRNGRGRNHQRCVEPRSSVERASHQHRRPIRYLDLSPKLDDKDLGSLAKSGGKKAVSYTSPLAEIAKVTHVKSPIVNE